jgi:hypothetical protein
MKSFILPFLFFKFILSQASEPSFSKIVADDAYTDSTRFFSNALQADKKRINLLNYSISGTYGLSMYWLYTQWYKDYPGSSFHFFNDNSEWLQMDKFAHTWDAYLISKSISNCYKWAGYGNKKSLLYGIAITGLYQTTIEVFDGFSKEWGFSGGDVLANSIGLTMFAFQELHWKEQRITLKLSFHQTKYSSYRPQLLGENVFENIIKDYNGLTNWVCINPQSFFKDSGFPKWLSLAIGFGAEGMTGGKRNPEIVNGKAIPAFDRYRQFYLSVDFELSKLKTQSAFFSSLFRVINIIHLPAPAIEFRSGGKPHYKALYF